MYTCRRCRTKLEHQTPKLCSCHFCHTYYCSKNCRKLDFPSHQLKCVGTQASVFTKQILRTVVNSNNCPLITRLCSIAYDGFCVQGRGALLIDLKELENLDSIKNVKQLIDERLSYHPKSKLPEKAVKTRKAVANYNPNESIILAITLNVPLNRMDMTRKEAGRAYRENSRFVESFSIMVNVESPKYRNWWVLKSAAIAERKKNESKFGGDETMILGGFDRSRLDSDKSDTVTVRSDTTSALIGANPYANCNFYDDLESEIDFNDKFGVEKSNVDDFVGNNDFVAHNDFDDSESVSTVVGIDTYSEFDIELPKSKRNSFLGGQKNTRVRPLPPPSICSTDILMQQADNEISRHDIQKFSGFGGFLSQNSTENLMNQSHYGKNSQNSQNRSITQQNRSTSNSTLSIHSTTSNQSFQSVRFVKPPPSIHLEPPHEDLLQSSNHSICTSEVLNNLDVPNSPRFRHSSQMSQVRLEFNGNLEEQKARQMAFAKILGNLRQRGVSLRDSYPVIYQKLVEFVETGESFTPIVIYPVDNNSLKTFMCLLMPGNNRCSPSPMNRPISPLSSIMQDLDETCSDQSSYVDYV